MMCGLGMKLPVMCGLGMRLLMDVWFGNEATDDFTARRWVDS